MLLNNTTQKYTIMKTLVETVILSHISDASIEINFNPELAKKRLHFVKLLVVTYPNTETKISIDEIEDLWQSI